MNTSYYSQSKRYSNVSEYVIWGGSISLKDAGVLKVRSVPCHHIREYRYAFGAVEPLSGESFFLTMPNCDTECTNIFLEKLSEQYPDDIILLVCDGAAWHKSKALRCPENIQLLSIPPYTPEMNPIEQIWKQIRSMGFRNEVFNSLNDVMNRLCETICMVTNDMIKSITGRKWIFNCFLE